MPHSQGLVRVRCSKPVLRLVRSTMDMKLEPRSDVTAQVPCAQYPIKIKIIQQNNTVKREPGFSL